MRTGEYRNPFARRPQRAPSLLAALAAALCCSAVVAIAAAGLTFLLKTGGCV